MASKTFSGQLDQAMNEAAAEGNKILFIPQQTVGEVLPGAASELVVESDGTYSIKLAYNNYSIYHYSDVTKRKTLLATDIVVSTDTAVTTIPDLLGSVVPVTEDSVLTIQGYLDEANEAKTDAEAAQAATEALFDDFDSSVADSMALVHTETPSLSIPFNESGRLDYGIGTEYVSGLPVYGVNLTRSTTSTVINKSGVLETLAADEIGIGADGAWLHGSYTNLHPSGNNLSNASYWSGANTVVTGSGTYAGASMYLLSDASTSEDVSLRYDFLTTLSTDTSYYIQFLIKNSDADATTVTLQGAGMSSPVSVVVSWDGSEISSITGAKSYRKISDDVYIVVSNAQSTASTSGNVSNYIFPASFASDGTTTGSIYIGAMMVIQSDTPKELPFILTDGAAASATATSCTVPVSGNLPPAGDSFTIVCDVAAPNTKSPIYSINGDVNFVLWRFSADSNVLLRVSDGTTTISPIVGSVVDDEKHRYAITYNSETDMLYTYDNGDLTTTTDTSAMDWSSTLINTGANIYLSGPVQSTYLNSQIKNFKILPYAASADEVKSWGAPK